MDYETIIFEKKDKIACVTMNKPETLNSLSYKMSAELTDVWRRAIEEDDIWAVILTGAGRAFNIGADMKEAARVSRTKEPRGSYRGYHVPWDMNKPMIGAINGMCAGGGLILLGACDIVICADDATFFDPHVSRGWLPLSETFATMTRMPYGLAMRMALMGVTERMSAERAYQVGLVSEVVPQAKLVERAIEIAKTICQQAPLSVRWIKETMRRTFIEEPYAGKMADWEKWVHLQVNLSHDGIEGPRAFAEHRPAQWTAEGGPQPRKSPKEAGYD